MLKMTCKHLDCVGVSYIVVDDSAMPVFVGCHMHILTKSIILNYDSLSMLAASLIVKGELQAWSNSTNQ